MTIAIPIEERLLRYFTIGPEDECWPWRGATKKAYGNVWDGTHTASGHPRMSSAHRVVYRTWVGDPGDLHVLHTCDNGLCVNYMQHLFLGTHDDNMADRHVKGRDAIPPSMRGFVRGHGHKLTAEQVVEIRSRFTGKRGEIKAMAHEFGISKNYMSLVISGRRWPPAP